MSRQAATWLYVSGYRFLLRRVERALLRGRTEALRGRPASLTVGCALAAMAMAGCAVLGLLHPRVSLDRARIVMGNRSGALYVRVGDTWHPVLNLASARLIAATAADPQPIPEPELGRTKRGATLGIPGAPQLLGAPLSAAESLWMICASGENAVTTVIVGHPEPASVRPLSAGQAILVTPGPHLPVYLLYGGHRAAVDVADTAVVRALRLEQRTPHLVSQSLLNAVPEVPPIAAPRMRGAGAKSAALPAFPVGSVLRITRGDGDEFYAVLAAGVQRIGSVAADLLRFSDSQGAVNVISVAPDAIGAVPVLDTLPVASFPDAAPAITDGGNTVCASSESAARADVALLTGSGLPLPPGRAPVALAQADGSGPALDAVYLPPGRSVYVRGGGPADTRYLVADTGVRFAVHDDDAAHDLGLAEPFPAPWPVLTTLPSGPELSRSSASVARDTVDGSP